MDKFFENKVIWITGASSGIGEALVKELATMPTTKLILSARSEDKLQDIVNECNVNERAFILPFNLEKIDNADDLVNTIIQRFGKIDVLINNGGVSQRSTAIETSEEIERKLFEVNYFSYIKLTKAVLPYMIKQHNGHIVVLSSIAGKFGFYLRSSYSAAKHALHGYFESLRLEIEKEGVCITIVCPGKIKTNVSINAVTASGKAHDKMDASHIYAMSAETAVKKILQAIAHQKEEMYVGGKELLMVWLKKYCRFLFNILIRKQSPY